MGGIGVQDVGGTRHVSHHGLHLVGQVNQHIRILAEYLELDGAAYSPAEYGGQHQRDVGFGDLFDLRPQRFYDISGAPLALVLVDHLHQDAGRVA